MAAVSPTTVIPPTMSPTTDPLSSAASGSSSSSSSAAINDERRSSDPFAHHRSYGDDAANRRASDTLQPDGAVPIAKRDRRMSKEWDAAKTPPSRFQKVEGSIWATPASRDGKVARNKIHGFKEKVKELSGGGKKKEKAEKAEKS